jgi:hypothetical protein
MKAPVVLICLFLFTLTVACGTAREKNHKKENSSIQSAELVDNIQDFREGAAVTILAVRLVENSMELDVEYSGGCETHSFRLLGSTMVLKSLPPQRGVMLFHENNGDNCRSIEQRTLKFDISALAYPGGEVILKLDGWDQNISYTPVK